jgi:NAD+ kinase
MKIALVSRIDDRKALEYALALRRQLAAAGHDVIFDRDTAGATQNAAVPVADPASARVVVVVGGDGTILRTVQRMDRQIPVIGINWGEVGFLADLEPERAAAFLTSLTEDFPVEQRMRIALYKEGVHIGDALNEAVIVTSRPAKMLRFTVVVDSIPAGQFRADGLLLSTPTGSTAYAMSAGGPIVDPRVHGFLLVPLAPYLLSSRPHLISSNRRVEVRLESAKPANLVLDGQTTIDLGSECVIELRRSPQPALFVDAGQNFFEKVESKLRRL